MAEIMVVGSLNMDLVIRTPHLPAPGETIIGSDFHTIPGGKGANQAVAAAKLGASVAMVGRVGADDFGSALRRNLELVGVNTTAVLTDESAPSGVALIAVDSAGQNILIISSGANALVSPADVDHAQSALCSSRVLVCQLETPLDATIHALRLARAAHVLTVLNPAPARWLDPEVLELCDVLIPNEVEASQMTGLPVKDWMSAEMAARLLTRRGARLVVITLGERGSLVVENGEARQIPAFVVEAIDGTAAGDAFVAAFAIARARGLATDEALREANAAGALTTTKLGAQPSLPSRAELNRFLQAAPVA